MTAVCKLCICQNPIPAAYVKEATAEDREAGGEMQRPPPAQDLVSRQAHFNQEIKVQYRLSPWLPEPAAILIFILMQSTQIMYGLNSKRQEINGGGF